MTLEINRFAWSTPRALHKHPPILNTTLLNSSPAFSEAAGVVSTARIERPLLHRGGSASTETMPAASPSPSECTRSASTRTTKPPSPLYFMRNAFEFSPEAVVTVRSTRPFLTPLGTVVVMLLLVC